ncbi:hypothetical protein D3C83_92990 [compost metagenome]
MRARQHHENLKADQRHCNALQHVYDQEAPPAFVTDSVEIRDLAHGKVQRISHEQEETTTTEAPDDRRMFGAAVRPFSAGR